MGATGVNGLIIVLYTEKRPLAEAIKKINLLKKSFFCWPFPLLCLVATQKIAHAAHSLFRLGELHVKVGYVSTLLAGYSSVSRGTLPPCKQALTCLTCELHITIHGIVA